MDAKMLIYIPNDGDRSLNQLVFFVETDFDLHGKAGNGLWQEAQDFVPGGCYLAGVVDVEGLPEEVYFGLAYATG